MIVAAALLARRRGRRRRGRPARAARRRPIAVEPNSVAIIDPETNDVVGTGPGRDPARADRRGRRVGLGSQPRRQERDPASIRDSRKVVETIPLDATPTGIAFGHGHLWAAHGLTGQVTRIDPELGGQKTFDVAETRRRSPDGAVAAGPSGVWAVFGDGTMARIDPTSGSVESAT